MRQYLANKLPGHSVHKLKKRGYTVPIARWLAENSRFKEYSRELISKKNIEDIGVFDFKSVEQLFVEHNQRQKNHYKKLWPIIVMQSWLKRHGVKVI